jgi:hypothetical protein
MLQEHLEDGHQDHEGLHEVHDSDTCMHACMLHACIHTYIHTYMHAYVHACTNNEGMEEGSRTGVWWTCVGEGRRNGV